MVIAVAVAIVSLGSISRAGLTPYAAPMAHNSHATTHSESFSIGDSPPEPVMLLVKAAVVNKVTVTR